ncbi:hypothetical protein [Actinophytocola oryzae]|uniref:DUF3309 family protein n=1 Tax=Actinophytocola oryzae TaxID=502181 RepID=A0A4R7W7Y2_9PSEU|nr:hypothetical protein [Actinophytocola oryzae]TDV57787.1 hypothetical protein CLV71_101660 [Actinophytocola oryzae]
MPWVRRHRRSRPGLFNFGSTTVRSHYRRSPGSIPIIGIVVAIVVILILIAIF